MKPQSLLHTYAINCNIFFVWDNSHSLIVKVVFGYLKNLHKAIEIGTPHSNFDLIIHKEL
jgi:hypothetical protein